MAKKYLKKGANYISAGSDCLTDEAKKIILSDKEFNDGIHSDCVTNDCMNRLAKQLGFFEDNTDYAEFQQELAVIARKETGGDWFVSEGLILLD